MVGCYSGAILLLADGQSFDQPVDRVSGGIEGLAGIIPAAGQLTVAEWDRNQASETYGEPVFYQFDEATVGAISNDRDAWSRFTRIALSSGPKTAQLTEVQCLSRDLTTSSTLKDQGRGWRRFLEDGARRTADRSQRICHFNR